MKNLFFILAAVLILLPTVATAQRELWRIPGVYNNAPGKGRRSS